MKKLKIGIIGCGWFGNFHLDFLLTRSDVEVVALVNSGAEALSQTGKKIPTANLYTSFEDMINTEINLDALIICVPPHRHNSIELISAQKGIHLYIEKPLSNNLEEAQKIAKVIARSGIICSIGYQERYANGIGAVTSLINNSSPYLAMGSWIGSTPSARWWWNKENSGGQIVEQSTHIVDLMRYFLGEAVEVFAMHGNKPHPLIDNGVNIDSCSIATISFASGTVGILSTGCFMTDGMPEKISLQILGENMQVEYNHGSGIKTLSHNHEQLYDFSYSNHQRAIISFIKGVYEKSTTPILSSYEDALKTFKLTLAIELSIKNKTVVKL